MLRPLFCSLNTLAWYDETFKVLSQHSVLDSETVLSADENIYYIRYSASRFHYNLIELSYKVWRLLNKCIITATLMHEVFFKCVHYAYAKQIHTGM